MSTNKLLIATHNQDKFKQICRLLKDTNYELVSLSDLGITHDVAETGSTYEENATLKAKAYAKLSGIPTIADDSGIEIDALNREPGIYASRYAGLNKNSQERAEFILEKMKGVPQEQRGAQFIVVIARVEPSGQTQLYRGVQHGFITTELRGSIFKHFIYNPIFLLPEHNKTLSELTDLGIDWHTTSARGQALHKLLQDLS